MTRAWTSSLQAGSTYARVRAGLDRILRKIRFLGTDSFSDIIPRFLGTGACFNLHSFFLASSLAPSLNLDFGIGSGNCRIDFQNLNMIFSIFNIYQTKLNININNNHTSDPVVEDKKPKD
ncbi:predicted protein [Sclerotinia sclerotiorum 1980 UF-70]|uniref:Uncharacterized protein n=1 Tax=Sclerotinia sclerotiorum (strain ATCC 18683 / 1980 / Ss-1) TaxID=665079 RepID=A7EZN3_SCLS1|nr:predicted protein [Sclerotinia sclerotiorum 1980 UF-70]EDN94925.1 predicted protein [Sclerotinia sclerotiorum 1980 UF-70]